MQMLPKTLVNVLSSIVNLDSVKEVVVPCIASSTRSVVTGCRHALSRVEDVKVNLPFYLFSAS